MDHEEIEPVEIPVMMNIELFGASDLQVRLFNAAIEELQWSKYRDRPTLYWSSHKWDSQGDSEILATCKHHLAIAASAAQIIDFEGTVILGLTEETWHPGESESNP
jgi:hypothetical protein